LITARAVSATALGEFMPLRMAHLETAQRTRLLRPAAVGSPLRVPEGLLAALRDAAAETTEQLDAAFSEAFPGFHLRLDETQRVELSLRVAAAFPEPAADPFAQARRWEALPRVDEQGDAWHCYAAVVLSMLLSRGRVVLIDEPELHLPPATAHTLGRWLSAHAGPLGCQLFLVTKSPSLLAGLFVGSADVGVVRVERRGSATTLRPTSAQIARSLALHPLLNGQEGVESFFAGGVVVVPESSDRLLLEALARHEDPLGETRFWHAHGGLHLSQLASLLRQAGLPFRIVAGFDIFRSELRFTQLLEAATGESPSRPWLATRERLASYLDGSLDDASLSASAQEVERFLDQLKQGGQQSAPSPALVEEGGADRQWQRLEREQAHFLPPELRIWVEELLEDLKPKGIFVSPKGPLWQWFGEVGRDPSSALLPALMMIAEGKAPADVRAFVAELLANLPRSGQPAPATRQA
jgi:hypothetical protein